jgi:hypothetical protein
MLQYSRVLRDLGRVLADRNKKSQTTVTFCDCSGLQYFVRLVWSEAVLGYVNLTVSSPVPAALLAHAHRPYRFADTVNKATGNGFCLERDQELNHHFVSSTSLKVNAWRETLEQVVAFTQVHVYFAGAAELAA